MISWSCPHTAWWLSPILFSWASDLPLLRLQGAHDLFCYFLWAVCWVTSSVSEHVAQSSEAVSISDLATFSPEESESDEACSLVHLELHATVPSSGSAVALVGLERGLVGSCPCFLKLGPVSGTNVGMPSSPCAELCSLLDSNSWELTWVLLLWWLPSESLEEWSCFLCLGLAMNPAYGHTTGGVPTKGISSKWGTGRGRISV